MLAAQLPLQLLEVGRHGGERLHLAVGGGALLVDALPATRAIRSRSALACSCCGSESFHWVRIASSPRRSSLIEERIGVVDRNHVAVFGDQNLGLPGTP